MTDSGADILVINRSSHFHTANRISGHKVGRCNVNLLLISPSEAVDSGVFKETPDNTDHMNILCHAFHTRFQTADTSDDQINFHSGLRSLDHLIDQNLIRKRIDLHPHISCTALFHLLNLRIDHIHYLVLQTFRRDKEFVRMLDHFSLLQRGKYLCCFCSYGLSCRDQRKICVKP